MFEFDNGGTTFIRNGNIASGNGTKNVQEIPNTLRIHIKFFVSKGTNFCEN